MNDASDPAEVHHLRLPAKRDLFSTRTLCGAGCTRMTALARSFPRTQTIKMMNWRPNIGELVAHGQALGGPDIMPNPPSWGYPFYPQYAGKLPLQISMQWPGPRQYLASGETTMEKMFDFAVSAPGGCTRAT